MSGAIKRASHQRLLAKIAADPYYGPALEVLVSPESILEAGFFDDGAPLEGAHKARAGDDWLMTPTHKIIESLRSLPKETTGPLVVLLSTGGFCPVHSGHISMMEIAKSELESRGVTVLGGYLAPDHDDYVSTKCGNETIDGIHRLRICEEAVRESSWLMADGWACLGAERALNFSEIIARLESYLAKHVASPAPIEIVYVFGGDNARFSQAFIKRGRCVCVDRPGARTAFDAFAKETLARNIGGRIIFAEKSSLDICSKDIRRGRKSMSLGAADEMFSHWTTRTDPGIRKNPLEVHYHLRNEQDWLFSSWQNKRDANLLREAWEVFLAGLIEAIAQAHDEASYPDLPAKAKFTIKTLAEQQKTARELTAGDKVISLDPCIPGDQNLSVSRRYALSAARSRLAMRERPESPSLAEQIKALAPGKYVLFDDDISSGATMQAVREMLPENIQVKHVCALIHRSSFTMSGYLDILDCRDFLAGSRLGGLVVETLDGAVARAPYCLPYVSPWDRASIPISSEIEFSRRIWELNSQFYNSVRPTILLQDADPSFQKLMEGSGFSGSDSMKSLCDWHIKGCLQAASRLVSKRAKSM